MSVLGRFSFELGWRTCVLELMPEQPTAVERIQTLIERAERARRLADAIRDDPGAAELLTCAREMDVEIARLTGAHH